jgi:hypothetical protein
LGQDFLASRISAALIQNGSHSEAKKAIHHYLQTMRREGYPAPTYLTAEVERA